MFLFSIARVLIGLSIVSFFSQTSLAATATTVLSVSSTVIAACAVGSSTLAFGAFTPGGVALDVNGSLAVTCTNGSSYTIALNAGSGAGATIPIRVLTNPSPAGTLQYTIYTTAARIIVWGDGTSGSATVAGTGTGVTQSVTVPGRIFAGQGGTATRGNYTDTVNITVTF